VDELRGEYQPESTEGSGMDEKMLLKGTVDVVLMGPDGAVKHQETIDNLVTDAGDLYYAQMGITGVSPANAVAPTLVASMKLGTGTTAAAKNGAGASIVTYKTGSAQAFDASYPQTNNLGAGLGVQAVYKVTWAAGTATDTALTEAVISTGTADSNAGTHIARVVFTAINKGAADTLAITWSHKFLGA